MNKSKGDRGRVQGVPAARERRRAGRRGRHRQRRSALLVASFVENLLTPLIAAIFGEQDFSNLSFTINGSVFKYGVFINALITFLTVAAAVFFFVVRPYNGLQERRARGEEATMKACPECASEIPFNARRCGFCTSQLA